MPQARETPPKRVSLPDGFVCPVSVGQKNIMFFVAFIRNAPKSTAEFHKKINKNGNLQAKFIKKSFSFTGALL